MKPTKCPAREKNEARKAKKREKRGEEKKRKVKVKTAGSLLNKKTEILLSAHARTSHFASGSEDREVYDL